MYALCRDTEDRCALFGCETSEEPHLYYLRFTWVKACQRFKSPIQKHQIQVQSGRYRKVLGEINPGGTGTGSGVINEDAAHNSGADS